MSFRLREHRNLVSFERSKVVRADFGSGMICPRAQTCMDSNVVRADFGSGLIRPRAQTCMDSNVVRADFGSGLIRPRAQIIPLPTLANQILARTFFSSVALHLAYPAVEKFCRASSAGGRRHLQ